MAKYGPGLMCSVKGLLGNQTGENTLTKTVLEIQNICLFMTKQLQWTLHAEGYNLPTRAEWTVFFVADDWDTKISTLGWHRALKG